MSSSSSSGDGTSGSSSSSSSGDRFSDDLEKLISRAGEKAAGFSRNNAAIAAGSPAAAGEGEGGEEDKTMNPEMSPRAMKFRAMISKLKPQKKAVVVKVKKEQLMYFSKISRTALYGYRSIIIILYQY